MSEENAENAVRTGWPLWSDVAKPFTIDEFQQAIEKMRTQESRICGVTHPHVVHPDATGPTPCANMCGAIVEVNPDAGEILQETP